ncbi:hypothetical protein [Mesorhizobium marinum]|uniref:Uncharacterized protein n=1 Tax=Mesorhizobium marinum TaxID=3228790 RepID=A0ABV3R2A0_9HYPH
MAWIKLTQPNGEPTTIGSSSILDVSKARFGGTYVTFVPSGRHTGHGEFSAGVIVREAPDDVREALDQAK